MKDINLSVNVFPIEEPQGSTLAFASVSVDDLIAIRGIRVIEGEKGLFVSMPQSKDKNGEFHDIAFPLSGDLRSAINKAILDKYAAEINVNRSDKKPSLNVRISDGKKKAAEQSREYTASAAKSNHRAAR